MIVWDILIKSWKCINSWGIPHQINSCKVSIEKNPNFKTNLIWFIFKACGCKAINLLVWVVFSQFCFLSLLVARMGRDDSWPFYAEKDHRMTAVPCLTVIMILSLSILKLSLPKLLCTPGCFPEQRQKCWVGHMTAAFSLWPILSPQLCRMSC